MNEKPYPLILITFLVCISIGVFFLLNTSFFKEDKQTSLSFLLDAPQSISAGGTLTFNRTIASASQPTLIILYTVKDSQGKDLLQKQEEVHIPDSSEISFSLVGFQPGEYLLQAEVMLGKTRFQQTAGFKIEEQTLCSDNILDGDEVGVDCGGSCAPCSQACSSDCDDGNPCSLDFCENNTCQHERFSPCCGDKVCDTGEVQLCLSDCSQERESKAIFTQEYVDPVPQIEEIGKKIAKVKELAGSDPLTAINFCEHLKETASREECYLAVAVKLHDATLCPYVTSSDKKDSCYQSVAREEKNSEDCGFILDPTKRDSCYVGFAKEGEKEVCPLISSAYLREYCMSFSTL